MAVDVDSEVKHGGLHHVVLIGFHHKKGCVVEYAYPPLTCGNEDHGDEKTTFLPEEWKFLPQLAMPDGAHNFTEDVVYFHLPPRQNMDEKNGACGGKDTVYCVSYCRQVDANLLLKKDEHVTRGTVQKSVVILSKIPAFGLIHAKLQLPLITTAFLENFANKDVLKELYNQINISLNVSDESHLFFGLSTRKLLMNFGHKLVMLFKLILLERRVIFYITPASELVGTIFALLSLFPRMIEIGLSECTNVSIKEKALKSLVQFDIKSEDQASGSSGDTSEGVETKPSSVLTDSGSFEFVQPGDCAQSRLQNATDEIVIGSLNTNETITRPPLTGQTISRAGNMMSKVVGKFGFLGFSAQSNLGLSDQAERQKHSTDYSHLDPENDDEHEADMLKLGNARLQVDVDSPEKMPVQSITSDSKNLPTDEQVDIPMPSFKVDDYGFPLSIFTNGHLCLPYVSLQHHDLMKRNSKNGFVVGATNILFQARKELSDVVVDVENAEIIFNDPSLQRLLSLSAADLRFGEHIMTNIFQHESEDFYNVATEWRGGDEWLRCLFAEYLHRMLCVASKDDIEYRKVQDFNESFVAAWRCTKNFQIWKRGKHKLIEDDAECQHPFHGQYSMSDVKLRLHHRLQNSEKGRKLEGAISNANDTLVNTGRYIGSAFGSAKSSLTSWFTSKVPTNEN